jgi:SOS response regulatory protein OraA/RecX
MPDVFSETLAKCLKLLARRDYFEKELRSRFPAVPEETLDRVIAHLKQRRFLDDTRASQEFIRLKSGKRSVSTVVLTQQLEERGAPADVVNSVSGRPDLQSAMEFLNSTYRRGDGQRAKAGRGLARHGFEIDDIESALEAFYGVCEELGE